MLYPKSVRERFLKEHEQFKMAYRAVLNRMGAIMRERGSIRDVNSPIYYRRDPGECLGLARNKLLRVDSLLTKLDPVDPDPKLLEEIVEECVDSSNYASFIAALCLIILDEINGEIELEVNVPDNVSDLYKRDGMYGRYGSKEALEQLRGKKILRHNEDEGGVKCACCLATKRSRTTHHALRIYG